MISELAAKAKSGKKDTTPPGKEERGHSHDTTSPKSKKLSISRGVGERARHNGEENTWTKVSRLHP